MPENDSIIRENSLQNFFMTRLIELNSKMVNKVSKEMLYYSSIVMDQMASSESFFQVEDGKVKNKVLAIKLLEAEGKSKLHQKRTYREIADTSLMVCGYFHSSVSSRLVDHSYYQMMGESSYRKLNGLVDSFLDVDSFFEHFARNFVNVSNLLSVLSSEFLEGQDLDKKYIVKAS